ncbi:MAG: hypothetical protein WDM87_17180 [Terracidiphilus sp.]
MRETVCRRHLLHNDAELGLTCAPSVVIICFGLGIIEIGKNLVAVADSHGRVLGLAITHEAEPDGRTGSAAGDFVYQIFAVLD